MRIVSRHDMDADDLAFLTQFESRLRNVELNRTTALPGLRERPEQGVQVPNSAVQRFRHRVAGFAAQERVDLAVSQPGR